MKCSRCNEECRENQAFCLKCGAPLQVMPDFNLIEAEIASNVGQMMEDIKNEEKGLEGSTGDLSERNVATGEKEIQLVDISRNNDVNDGHTRVIEKINASNDNVSEGHTRVIENIDKKLINDSIEAEANNQPKMVNKAKATENDNRTKISDNQKIKTEDGIKAREEVKKKQTTEANKAKNKKKSNTSIIVASIILAVLAIVVIFLLAVNSIGKKATSYEEFLKNAETKYEKLDTDGALKDANNALDKASNVEEKLEARTLIFDIMTLAGTKNKKYADNLEELVLLGTVDPVHFKALADYYNDNKLYDKLSLLITGVEDKDILKKLTDYVIEEPKADKETGDYPTYISVELKAPKGCTIRYTIDSRNPSVYGDEYEEPIIISTEGKNVLKAISINEKGIESKVVTYEYNITLEGGTAPVVTPKGGAYTDYTQITIDVPDGAKAYYTWDGTTPNEDSTLYTGPIEMPRRINVLKVVLVDEFGIYSDVTTESYNLQVKATITLTDALKMIEDAISKNLEEGYTVKATYVNTVTQDNDEFYVILCAVNDEEGEAKSVTAYGVNSYDSSVRIANDDSGEYVVTDKIVSFE